LQNGLWAKLFFASFWSTQSCQDPNATSAIGWALEIINKAKGAKPLENSSTRSFGGQGRMESVHAQGHVNC
jgi:hypothetical protein